MARESKVKVGDRFGKLTVIQRVEMPIDVTKMDANGKEYKEPTGKTKKVWECKCDCGETIFLPTGTLTKKRSSLRSCDKCPPEKDESFIPKRMTYEENQEWEELYEYVKTNILRYDKEQLLPNNITVRLLGLSRGKHMANNQSKNNANYSYKTILNTFKYCSQDIQKGLRTNKFNDEQHKFNYVAKVIENNINNVYLRMRNAEKAKEEARNTTIDFVSNVSAEYQKKTKETTNKLLDDLW